MPDSDHHLGVQTLPALFDQAVERFSTSVAMKSRYPWGYQSITYQKFGRLVSFLGAGLIDMGLEKGDRAAILAGNSPEWTISYAAAAACGAAVVPLDTNLNENEIRHLLLHSESSFLFVSTLIYDRYVEAMHLENTHVIVIGESAASNDRVETLKAVTAVGEERINSGGGEFFRRKSEVKPDDIAAICYTSGTTGQPKGAALLHRNITANIDSIRRRLPISNLDVFLSLLPLHHTFAATCNFLTPLSCGSTIVFGSSMKPRDISEDVTRDRVTIFVGVPLLFDHMLSSMKRAMTPMATTGNVVKRLFRGMVAGLGRIFRRKSKGAATGKMTRPKYLESIRFCISGAAALRPDTEAAFASIGIPVLQGYGLTEASPVVSVNPLDKPKNGTVGPPLPGVEVEIYSPNSEGIGEIVVKGPNVMSGYYLNTEETGKVLKGDRLFTGDLGIEDAEGYITVVGRKKSVIVTDGGKNVYPDGLEIRLNKSPYIMESIVMSVKDEKGRGSIGAIVIPDYDMFGSSPPFEGKLTEENVRAALSEEIKAICSDLPGYMHITEFQIRDQELPKTTTRKVKRHLVKWIDD